jgi:hypothetical protein
MITTVFQSVANIQNCISPLWLNELFLLRIEQVFEELAQSLVLRKQKLIGEVDAAITALVPFQQEANTFLSQLQSMEEDLKKTLADKLPPTNLIKQASVHLGQFSKLETTRRGTVSHVKAKFKGATVEELKLGELKATITSFGSIRTQLVSVIIQEAGVLLSFFSRLIRFKSYNQPPNAPIFGQAKPVNPSPTESKLRNEKKEDAWVLQVRFKIIPVFFSSVLSSFLPLYSIAHH